MNAGAKIAAIIKNQNNTISEQAKNVNLLFIFRIFVLF